MVMGYADPFEMLFAFQRALENRLSSDWLGTTTAAMGTYPPINVFQQRLERRMSHIPGARD
jgi:HSP20 family protein